MMFSSKYRAEMLLEKGECVWRKLDKDLPRAVGVSEDDEQRLKEFAKRYKNLPKQEQIALTAWLENRLCDLEHNWCENVSATSENFEHKWKQIFRTHLEAVN